MRPLGGDRRRPPWLETPEVLVPHDGNQSGERVNRSAHSAIESQKAAADNLWRNLDRRGGSIQPPAARNAFQLTDAALVELKLGACHEVPDRRGDQDFAWAGLGAIRAPMLTAMPATLSHDLAFAGVQAGADF